MVESNRISGLAVASIQAFVIAISIFWIAAAERVFGREFVIDNRHPAASDTNPGSAEAPLKTIQRAADLAQPGDRVLVKAGRYPETRDAEHLAGVVMENNLYTSLSWVQTPETLGSNAIVEKDPSKVFLDFPEGNYHLRSDSPARDAGTPVTCTQDLDGVDRPQGRAFDIGAYEYTDTPSR